MTRKGSHTKLGIVLIFFYFVFCECSKAAGVPIHHSLPGATNIIYINVLGATITATQWNRDFGTTTYVAKPLNFDGVAGLSAAEQTAISRIWARVAEDYIPWRVDVTTERPATFTATTGTILITEDVDANGVALPGQGGGGIAYLNVFGDASYPRYSLCLRHLRSYAACLRPTVHYEI